MLFKDTHLVASGRFGYCHNRLIPLELSHLCRWVIDTTY